MAKPVKKAATSQSAKVTSKIKKPSASTMSAKSHQKDLARISGGIAQSKDKNNPFYDWQLNTFVKAESKTRKSFGLKNKGKSQY